MIITSALTVGQLTFTLRVAIQILSYGGLFLLGRTMLGSAPRVASIQTHDVLNRAVGKSSFNMTAIKWIFNHLRGRNGDRVVSPGLLLSILLLVLYAAFVSLSDLGFLGFSACSTAGHTTFDYPASINTDALASAAVNASLINGTDPNTVKAYRCDNYEVVHFGVNVTLLNCTTWHNSTYTDPALFSHLNTTDTDVLMPRQINHLNQSRSQYVDLNSFYLGPGSQLIATPTVANGLVVNPHETGIQAVVGVPQLSPQHKVVLNKTLALEVDVGCMSLGIYSSQDSDGTGEGFDYFATNGTWREYNGPDYLQSVLAKTVDDIRQYYLPIFNTSTLDSSGLMTGINASNAVFSPVANVKGGFLPKVGSTDPSTAYVSFMGNCTTALMQQLNLTVQDPTDAGNMCGMMMLGGSTATGGLLLEVVSNMVCAAATQVNMVSATVEQDAGGIITLSITRLPSDLNYVRADYWDAMQVGNNTQFNLFMPIERFTLSDNPASPTSHFITAYEAYGVMRSSGPGSGGSVFSRVGNAMLDQDGMFDFGPLAGLTVLDAGMNQINFNTTTVTRWAGQLGASFVLASASYNGWAARSANQVAVLSTGGELATCYNPRYAIAFLPLVLAALVVAAWAAFMLFTSRLSGCNKLGRLYGGMGPYTSAVSQFSPDLSPQSTLVWETTPQPHLEALPKGSPLPADSTSETALAHLKTSSSGI